MLKNAKCSSMTQKVVKWKPEIKLPHTQRGHSLIIHWLYKRTDIIEHFPIYISLKHRFQEAAYLFTS